MAKRTTTAPFRVEYRREPDHPSIPEFGEWMVFSYELSPKMARRAVRNAEKTTGCEARYIPNPNLPNAKKA